MLTSRWRWLVVLAGVAVLVGAPAAISAWPVKQSNITAAQLLARIAQSKATPYSGYAESSGGLALPVTRQLSSVADLFGETTQMRAWWRDDTSWRLDTITFAGETDTHGTPCGTWQWDYESNRATFTEQCGPVDVRLPQAGDLLPTNLARRLLSEATPDEISRISAVRVAGRSAPGLRLTPKAAQSTVGHVDLWADLATGLPLRVEVYGKGSNTSVLSSKFLEFSTRMPSTDDVTFKRPPGAHVSRQNAPDLAAAIDRFGGVTPPAELAGLPRNQALPSIGSIGVYGTGVTEFAAAPLPDRVEDALGDQLRKAAVRTPAGLATSIGPLSLLLTPDVSGSAWLLTGTVTAETLAQAAAHLPPSTEFR